MNSISSDDLNPTDYAILEILAAGQRETRGTLAEELDKQGSYVSNRLKNLRNENAVRRVGDVETSGLYAITPVGRMALQAGAVETFPRLSPHMTPLRYTILDQLNESQLTKKGDLYAQIEHDRVLVSSVVESLIDEQLILEGSMTMSHADLAGRIEVTGLTLSELGKRVLEKRETWVSGGDEALGEALGRITDV